MQLESVLALSFFDGKEVTTQIPKGWSQVLCQIWLF
jgi:hypothetical protein